MIVDYKRIFQFSVVNRAERNCISIICFISQKEVNSKSLGNKVKVLIQFVKSPTRDWEWVKETVDKLTNYLVRINSQKYGEKK